MDVFYEESSTNYNTKRGEKKYKVLNCISWICLIFAVLMLVSFIFNFPFFAIGNPDLTDEAVSVMFFYGTLGIQGVILLVAWFIFFKWKASVNISYDYCFVSGELRVSKVFNVNKRKLVTCIDCEDILQIGDVDNSSYERLRADPITKQVVCTSNVEAGEGKFLMYVLTNHGGKTLYLLECRENLLMNVMKFARRTVLESDYVMQEKKQK